MTAHDASAATDPIAGGVAGIHAPETIVCGGFKEAQNLAASQRRSHSNRDAYAAYDVALAAWCVK